MSKLATFLIANFALLNLYSITQAFNDGIFVLSDLKDNPEFLHSIIFQVLVLIIFAARFVILFFQTTKALWINQILWLLGFTILASYWFISRQTESSFEIYSTYTSIFIFASRSFDFFGMWYLILSPIRQIVTLLISFAKAK